MNALNLWTSNAWNPAREIFSLFEDAGQTAQRTGKILFTPPVDVEETQTHFLFTFDLPGVDKNDVKIEINDNVLSVSGERKSAQSANENKGATQLLSERVQGCFVREFSLPSTVSTDNIEARYENGVLHISMPKAENAKPRQIKVV